MSQPRRLSVALPVSGTFPRVGKIRLGTTTLTGKKDRYGADLVRPVKADHFIVAEDESGITSAEAAAAFFEVYGEEPRTLHAMLPGHRAEDVLEGAWRVYGKGKLKRRCDGETCDERTATGWVQGPCACLRDGLAADDREHCTLTYTLQLLLPDVAGVGVWQLDTGSEISARRMADWLVMMMNLRGSLALVEFDLRLVPVSVAPDGRATTVYVLDPQARLETPRQAIHAAATRASTELPALPAPVADDEPEQTLDRAGFDASPAGEAPSGEADIAPAPAGEDPHQHIIVALRGLDTADKAFLRDEAARAGVAPVTVGRIARWLYTQHGDRAAADLAGVLDEMNGPAEAKDTTPAEQEQLA